MYPINIMIILLFHYICNIRFVIKTLPRRNTYHSKTARQAF